MHMMAACRISLFYETDLLLTELLECKATVVYAGNPFKYTFGMCYIFSRDDMLQMKAHR